MQVDITIVRLNHSQELQIPVRCSENISHHNMEQRNLAVASFLRDVPGALLGQCLLMPWKTAGLSTTPTANAIGCSQWTMLVWGL